MFIRALIVWLGLLAVAIANGGIREALIIPATGNLAGHAISTITLCIGILALALLTTGWMHPASANDALLIGAGWLGLTLAFEFLAGHYLFGKTWESLLADYNVFRGRIWVLVLVTTMFAPAIGLWGRSR